jgi:hypothetical protein
MITLHYIQNLSPIKSFCCLERQPHKDQKENVWFWLCTRFLQEFLLCYWQIHEIVTQHSPYLPDNRDFTVHTLLRIVYKVNSFQYLLEITMNT